MADTNSSDGTGERPSGDKSNDSVKVTLIADEWLSKKGGLSTINRELSMQLAKSENLKVSLFMRQRDSAEKNRAEECNVAIIESQAPNEEEWWKFPPTNFKTDCVIGHGAKLGKQAEYLRDNFKCKWVQVVHTEPEELSSSKRYPGAGAKGEEKSEEEVRLCRNADMVVGIGPKLTEAYNAKLRPHKEVFDLTPGILKEFVDIKQASNGGRNFRVLIFGRADTEDTSLKDQKHDEVKERLKDHGLLEERFLTRSFCKFRERLAENFQEADLVIMPSRSEGFGLTALEALSAGLPILIGWNTGLAQALEKVPSGTSCKVNTDDPSSLARAIKEVRGKERKIRLEEARRLREDYDKEYPWEAQCEKLVEEMLKLHRHDLAEVSTIQHVNTAPQQASSSQLKVKYKDGKPSDAQLLELSIRVASKWERIGLLLGLSQDQIDDIKVNKDDKAYSMLLEWRNITTSPIPYKALYDVLCHKTVRLDVVAREFCLSQTR
ncbi:D-inositol 3-phosphate glycosyltransferase [Stylophora pistillata]|uniref:D-inositol 3-phosphate glycosyltransferase n=1 Tax=Stylophora pistillata TaxID=50429 RepID=A0A2B4S4H5_STYPI|nr:D-inositol 3-phosphate glycosyltransferase [Stylophora pistillata]